MLFFTRILIFLTKYYSVGQTIHVSISFNNFNNGRGKQFSNSPVRVKLNS